MLSQDTKRKIDNARDMLVGKIPDPKGQVDQITTALIYKFMDDVDNHSVKTLGGKAGFFIKELKPFAWHKLFEQTNNQQTAQLYIDGVEKLSKASHLPQLFQDIFKDAFVPFRAADTITLFLKQINEFPHYQSNSEELGNAFEYLLHFMGTQGDAGQFRTPRHIIDFIVDVVAPTKNDKILDPACGTAGFLVSAYNYIKKDGKLTPQQINKLSENIKGVDIDPQMAKIARVNLYLHGFKTPEIGEDDTLTNEALWGIKYNVILANPPFMTPKGGIQPHDQFGIKANRSEVLFVDYIAEHLRLNGRAGIIVPEGIIFQAANAYKTLRKNLVDTLGLYAVVSLPSGVFNPYSGVKTSILFIDRKFSQECDSILFVKITNDGLDLGAQRRKIDKDDLPAALLAITQWKQTQRIPAKYKTLAHSVSKKKIAKNNDYNLTGERYRERVDYSNAKWKMVELGEICEITSGQSPEGKYYNEHQEGLPFYQGKTEFREYYIGNPQKWTSKVTKVAQKDDILMSVRAPVGPVNFAVEKICIGRGLASIRGDKDKVKQKFLFYFLKNIEKTIIGSGGAVFDSISREQIKQIKVPLPPLEIQEQIVAEIDAYQKIIDGIKQVTANWKPQIKITLDGQMITLGNTCKTTSGGTPLKSKNEYYDNGTIPWLRSGEVSQGEIYKSKLFITEKGLKNSSAKLLPKGTVLVAMYGATAGQVGLLKFESTTNQAICGILPHDKFIPEYLYQILKSQKDVIIRLAGGGAQPNISQTIIKNLQIPLPPLEVQKQIVAEIEAEQKVVTECRIFATKMQQKITTKINEVWGNKS